MNPAEKSSSAMNWLLGTAAFVVVVAGMKAAAEIIVPLLIALFLSIICYPALYWMQKRRVPTLLALLAIVAVVTVLMLGVVAVVGSSVRDFTGRLDFYADKLEREKVLFYTWLADNGIRVPQEMEASNFDPARALHLFGQLLAGLGGVFSNIFLVLLLVVFMLLEAATIPRKAASLGSQSSANVDKIEQIRTAVWSYVSIKTGISFVTGGLVSLMMWLLKVDYPVLWGLLAFSFNFVPNIGSIMAAVPAVLLALLQHGIEAAFYATMGFVLINIILGNVVEPRMMGRGMGLSTLVVFLSLIFWGWVLGPVGMILSVPLTMILKIVLESSDETHWVAVLLGNESEVAAGKAE